MKKIYEYAIAVVYGCFLIGGAVLAKITVSYLFEMGLFWYFLGLVAVVAIIILGIWFGKDDKDKKGYEKDNVNNND